MISVQCRCLSSFTKLKTRNPLRVFFFISSSVNSLSVQNSHTQEKLQVFYLTQNKKVSSALSNKHFLEWMPDSPLYSSGVSQREVSLLLAQREQIMEFQLRWATEVISLLPSLASSIPNPGPQERE